MRGTPATIELREVLAEILPDRPFRVQFWDGTALARTNGSGGPTFSVCSPRALGHVLGAPGQLGIGRAYVSGEIEVDDMDAALDILDGYSVRALDTRAKARFVSAALRAGAFRSLPRAPAAELRPRGRRHSRKRDQRAVRHHYDVSSDFFRLLLGESMTYSCAIFSRGAQSLKEPRANTAFTSVASRCQGPRRRGPVSVSQQPGWRTGFRFASPTIATSRPSSSTRSLRLA